MTAQAAQMHLDPTALAAFAGGLANLPPEEIRKAKKLYLLNAITDMKAQRGMMRTMVIVFGCMSIIPIFLIVFIPTLVTYRTMTRAGREKIQNAIDVWRDDLGDDYEMLRRRVLE